MAMAKQIVPSDFVFSLPSMSSNNSQTDTAARETATVDSNSTTKFSLPAVPDSGSEDLFKALRLEPSRMLNEGSAGVVFLAKSLDKNHLPKAVKVFSVRTRRGKRFDKNAFLKEVSIMNGLDHPCILGQALAGRCSRYYAIAMPFCPNGDMEERLLRERLPEELLERYIAQLACGVRYLHSMRIYHGDIKLENLLLDENEDLKLTDFGHSQILPPDSQIVDTIGGTIPYLAPECYKPGDLDAFKLDAFAVGATIWAMISRRDMSRCEFKHFSPVLDRKPFRKSPFRYAVTNLLLEDPQPRWTVTYLCRYLRLMDSMVLFMDLL